MKKIIFQHRIITSNESIPPSEKVSAVFLVALKNDAIVVIRNHRGWDLPAGHLEDSESVLEALLRNNISKLCVLCSVTVVSLHVAVTTITVQAFT